MKTIYTSNILSISYCKSEQLIIQQWLKSPASIEIFKTEMLTYVSFYKKLRPYYSLWLQKNFCLQLDNHTFVWLEENVNIPCLKYGNKKCAFVVSKDVYAHLSIIDSFDKLDSCITPKHFVSEKKAKEWLYEEIKIQQENNKDKLFFDGIDEDGNLKIRIPSYDIKYTLKSLNKVVEKQKFKRIYQYKYNLLTKREKEILSYISRGESHQKIAELLFISLHTVRTHSKNIKLKLDFSNNSEFHSFLQSFSF